MVAVNALGNLTDRQHLGDLRKEKENNSQKRVVRNENFGKEILKIEDKISKFSGRLHKKSTKNNMNCGQYIDKWKPKQK